MNKHEGSTLESMFEELSELEEVEARAAKKVLAIQAERSTRPRAAASTDKPKRVSRRSAASG